MQFGKYSFDFDGLAKELARVLKVGGVVVWVVGDQTVKGFDGGSTETGNSFRQALGFQECGLNIHDTMIYKKPGVRFPDVNRYHQCFEYMFVLSKGKPKTVNIIKDRKNLTYNKNANSGKVKNKREKDDGYVVCDSFYYALDEYGARYNIWEIPLEQSTKGDVREWNWHPAVFASSLARDHIITWTNKGDLVIDPFSGSGTTAKEAKRLDRNYIGIEINKEYVEKSTKRIEQYHGASKLSSLIDMD